MSEFEEETYSTIFAALKHPIRRRILRLLSEGTRSFTEMQNLFKVDSPYLTYHLDSLKDLVSKTEEGNYRLSSMGESALALMEGVEEPPKPVALRYRLPLKWKSCMVALVFVTLILGGVCFVQYQQILGYSQRPPTYIYVAKGPFVLEKETNETRWGNMTIEIDFDIGESPANYNVTVEFKFSVEAGGKGPCQGKALFKFFCNDQVYREEFTLAGNPSESDEMAEVRYGATIKQPVPNRLLRRGDNNLRMIVTISGSDNLQNFSVEVYDVFVKVV